MTTQPTLQTARLILRPFTLADAPDVQHYAGAREVARMTQVPHPYEDGMAEAWIGAHADNFAQGRAAQFAVTEREGGAFCGVVSLEMSRYDEGVANLGYWIAVPFWGNGYATEAARAIVDFGFEALALQRISSGHFGSNPASGRVMQKLGMQREGCQREHILKWGEREDLVMYGLLRREWQANQPDAD